jgi:hypothetical protein
MMSRRLVALALFGALALTLAMGCTKKVHLPPNAPVAIGPTVTPDSVQAIFTANCISCHSGPFAPAGMDLSADSSYAKIVGIISIKCNPLKRIEPFQPDNSCLVLRIEGAVTPRMPLGGVSLAPADINRIRNWVLQGARGVTLPALTASR